MKIVFINGPPMSGKDTAADALYRSMRNARRYQMKQPIIDAIRGTFNLTFQHWKELNERDQKEIPQDVFFGRTPREVMISFSEEWMKPFFTPEHRTVFGELAVRELLKSKMDLCAIPDSGFRQECVPVVKQFGYKNCLLVKLKRDGCTYANDSRSYIDLSTFGVPERVIDNYVELEWFGPLVVKIVKTHFNIT